MLQRRHFIGMIPAAAISLPAGARAFQPQSSEQNTGHSPLIASPPVVQHPARDAFSVHLAVTSLATGWVEWGTTPEQLDHKAVAQHHGLIQAHDRALGVHVKLGAVRPSNRTIYYRIVAQPLAYQNAYELKRGTPESSRVYALRLPDPDAAEITVAIVNDTHEQPETLQRLHERIEAVQPDVLVWNGDTCNDFDQRDDLMQLVLNPAGDVTRGWAAERPLLFVPGNHDVRGARARELPLALGAWPGQPELPYNFALRLGPLALVGMDTGEDKPDAHPVFAGTAAYEPYREQQALWLQTALARDEIASAKLRIAVCHIPLRGRPGDNDGTSLEGFAAYSGFGARLWLPALRQAGFQAVISGHTHRHRIDDPTDKEPVTQIVGGAPQPDYATLTLLHASASTLTVRVENLSGQTLHERGLGG